MSTMCQTLCKVTIDRHRDEKSPCSRNICFVYLEGDLHMNKSNIRRHLLTTQVMKKNWSMWKEVRLGSNRVRDKFP